MFFELLATTPAWLARYACDSAGTPMPTQLILEATRSQRFGLVYRLRNMAAVAYMERELYETPDGELTVEGILEASRRIDRRMTGLREATHPLMTLSHFYSSDSAAYFHNYVLAELAAYQTISMLETDQGFLVDNPAIGPILADRYWSAGNSRSLFDVVEDLTGDSLSPDSLRRILDRPDEVVAEDALRQVSLARSAPAFDRPVDLDLALRLVHGVEDVASNTGPTSFEAMAEVYTEWLRRNRNPASDGLRVGSEVGFG
jgi:hypothetical protein